MASIGIPKSFFYYYSFDMWKNFFEKLGFEIVVSPDTDRDMIKNGSTKAIDECCVPQKIYIGHVMWLVENTKVDYILVPRISYYGDRLFTCTKFRTCPDVIINFNILKDKKMLTYNIDTKRGINELDAYKALGQDLNKTEEEILEAYKFAREIIENTTKEKSIKFNTLLNLKTNKIKILVVGHSYNTLDAYIGKPITDYLYKAGCIVLFSEDYDPDLAKETAKRELPTLRYENSQRQFGAAYDAQNNIDGIILITAFPCGPDSMTNDMIIRRIKSVPIIQLIVDEQEGSAGRETRLESFLDIINFKHKKYECS